MFSWGFYILVNMALLLGATPLLDFIRFRPPTYKSNESVFISLLVSQRTPRVALRKKMTDLFLLKITLYRMLHSHWSRSVEILCFDWWNLTMLKFYAIKTTQGM